MTTWRRFLDTYPRIDRYLVRIVHSSVWLTIGLTFQYSRGVAGTAAHSVAEVARFWW